MVVRFVIGGLVMAGVLGLGFWVLVKVVREWKAQKRRWLVAVFFGTMLVTWVNHNVGTAVQTWKGGSAANGEVRDGQYYLEGRNGNWTVTREEYYWLYRFERWNGWVTSVGTCVMFAAGAGWAWWWLWDWWKLRKSKQVAADV